MHVHKGGSGFKMWKEFLAAKVFGCARSQRGQGLLSTGWLVRAISKRQGVCIAQGGWQAWKRGVWCMQKERGLRELGVAGRRKRSVVAIWCKQVWCED